jgi:hypothetical protein
MHLDRSSGYRRQWPVVLDRSLSTNSSAGAIKRQQSHHLKRIYRFILVQNHSCNIGEALFTVNTNLLENSTDHEPVRTWLLKTDFEAPVVAKILYLFPMENWTDATNRRWARTHVFRGQWVSHYQFTEYCLYRKQQYRPSIHRSINVT